MSLQDERCPYCFSKFDNAQWTDDPILTKGGSSFIYDEETGLLIPRPSATEALYEGSTIVNNQHIIELQEANDDNKPDDGWTPVKGEAGSFWIPNKIHIKEIRDAVEKGLGITEETTPAERTVIMEQYLNYDEDGIERQNPHQLDWNDPTLTGTVWMGHISHMHIEDLRKIGLLIFAQYWWENGTDGCTGNIIYKDWAWKENSLHKHTWGERALPNHDEHFDTYYVGGLITVHYDRTQISSIERTGTNIHIKSDGYSFVGQNGETLYGANGGISLSNGYLAWTKDDNDNTKINPTSRLLIDNLITASMEISEGTIGYGTEDVRINLVIQMINAPYTQYGITYSIIHNNLNIPPEYGIDWFPLPEKYITLSLGNFDRNIYNDLINQYPGEEFINVRLTRIIFISQAYSTFGRNAIPNVMSGSCGTHIDLSINNVIFYPIT